MSITIYLASFFFLFTASMHAMQATTKSVAYTVPYAIPQRRDFSTTLMYPIDYKQYVEKQIETFTRSDTWYIHIQSTEDIGPLIDAFTNEYGMPTHATDSAQKRWTHIHDTTIIPLAHIYENNACYAAKNKKELLQVLNVHPNHYAAPKELQTAYEKKCFSLPLTAPPPKTPGYYAKIDQKKYFMLHHYDIAMLFLKHAGTKQPLIKSYVDDIKQTRKTIQEAADQKIPFLLLKTLKEKYTLTCNEVFPVDDESDDDKECAATSFLQHAHTHNKHTAICTLLAFGAHPSCGWPLQTSVLSRACQEQNENLIRMYLMHGANPAYDDIFSIQFPAKDILTKKVLAPRNPFTIAAYNPTPTILNILTNHCKTHNIAYRDLLIPSLTVALTHKRYKNIVCLLANSQLNTTHLAGLYFVAKRTLQKEAPQDTAYPKILETMQHIITSQENPQTYMIRKSMHLSMPPNRFGIWHALARNSHCTISTLSPQDYYADVQQHIAASKALGCLNKTWASEWHSLSTSWHINKLIGHYADSLGNIHKTHYMRYVLSHSTIAKMFGAHGTDYDNHIQTAYKKIANDTEQDITISYLESLKSMAHFSLHETRLRNGTLETFVSAAKSHKKEFVFFWLLSQDKKNKKLVKN